MSEKVDLKKVLEGLDTECRRSGDGEIHVYLNFAFEPQLFCGKSDVDVRVLTPDASKMLLERLNAEIRVPCRHEVIWGNNGWYTTTISHSKPRICKKKPEPEFRVLEPGEPAMPGDILFSSADDNLGECSNHYRNRFPGYQNDRRSKYKRKPWTKEEYLKRQAEWVEFYNLKPGDTVKVCCKAKDGQDGWEEFWCEEMYEAVGKVFRVKDIQTGGIQSVGDKYLYPFYVLQVVKKPEPVKPVEKIMASREPVKPKYREFRTPQEVLSWVQEHGQIVVKENGDWTTIIRCEKGTSGLYLTPAVLEYTDTWNHWKSAKDGTPFGVPE